MLPVTKRLPTGPAPTIAAHFAHYVWAHASGGVLTISVRSPASAYSLRLLGIR